LRDLSIVEGEKVHFDAKVAPVGDPTMKVEWFCNGKAIAASKSFDAYAMYTNIKIFIEKVKVKQKHSKSFDFYTNTIFVEQLIILRVQVIPARI